MRIRTRVFIQFLFPILSIYGLLIGGSVRYLGDSFRDDAIGQTPQGRAAPGVAGGRQHAVEPGDLRRDGQYVGGDRETFDFDDPDNWLRVDDDVWIFGPAG